MSDEDDFFHPPAKSPVPTAMLTAIVTTLAMFFALRALDERGLIPSLAKAPTAAVPSVVASAVEIPSLLGLRPEQARAALNARDLLLVLIGDRSSGLYPAGTLADQTPLAGSQAQRGATVQGFVSSGPKQLRLPSLVGLKADEALRQLGASDLVAGPQKTLPSESVPTGIVLQTDPVAGTALPAQSAVALIVSSGPVGKPVPKVIGLRLAAARERLEQQGFTLGKVRQESNADRAPGVVLTQKPLPDVVAALGTAVELVVNDN